MKSLDMTNSTVAQTSKLAGNKVDIIKITPDIFIPGPTLEYKVNVYQFYVNDYGFNLPGSYQGVHK